MEDEIIYQNSGDISSYPYQFDVRKEGEKYRSEVIVFIYDKVKTDQPEQLNQALQNLPHIENSGFCLEDDKVVYRSFMLYDNADDIESMEVETRRHFIEDYLEEAVDIDQLLKDLPHHTLKTEFVNVG